jgi:hypothetical protein
MTVKWRKYLSVLLWAMLVIGCGNSSMNDFVTGDVVAEDLTGASQVELRFDLTREQTANRDIRRLRLSAYNAQGNLVYGPHEVDASATVKLSEVPRFARTLEIEYLSGSDSIVVGIAEMKLTLSEGQFASIVDPPFEQVPPGKIRINPRAIALGPGETVDMRALEDQRDRSVVDLTQKVIWTSSDPSRLRVSNAAGQRGRVTPVGEFRGGDVQITARVGAAQVVAVHGSDNQGSISGTYYQGKVNSGMFGPVAGDSSITCIDLNGDGTDEVAIASGSGIRGIALGGAERFRFEPWVAAPGTRLSLAAADVNGDGQADLIVGGVAAQGTPLIRGYDGYTLSRPQPRVLFNITDLSPNYSGGVNLAAAVGSSGGPLVAAGAGPGRSPEVSVYGLYKGPNESLLARLSERRLVFEAIQRGGVRVALGDLDFDGVLDLVSAPGPGSAALVVASSIGGLEMWRAQLESGPTSQGVTLACGQLYGGPEDDVVARVAYEEPDDTDQSVILDGAKGSRVFSFDAFGEGPVSLSTGNVGLADQRRATAAVRLTTAKLARIELTPTVVNLSSQAPLVQLTATARYADGMTLDATDLVALSLAPNIAKSSVRLDVGAGLVTAMLEGVAVVRASYRGLVGESEITISDPPIPRTISVVPVDASGREGTDVRFSALASLDGGIVIDLTDRVSWTSENEGVVRFNNNRSGVGQVRGQGKAVVVANDKISGVVAKMVFHGVPKTPPNGLEITPDVVKLTGVTQTRTLTVQAKYADGLEIPVTDSITWTSSNPDIKVNGFGKVSVLPATRESGTATITATVTSLGQTATARVDLELPPLKLQALYVSPSRPILEPDQALPLAVEGRYGESSSSLIQAVTSGLTFISSHPEIVKVSATGVLRAGSLAGTAQITVTHESGVRTMETAEVSLPLPLLQSIAVGLTPLSVADGEGSQARATGTYDTGPPKDLSNSVVWSSSNPAVATVSSSGSIETFAQGVALISAIDLASGKNGEAVLTVTPARLLSIAISPGNPATTVGSSLALTAEGTYTNGEILPVNPVWTSQLPAIFGFTGAGIGTGMTPGVATVIATLGEITSSTSISVSP